MASTSDGIAGLAAREPDAPGAETLRDQAPDAAEGAVEAAAARDGNLLLLGFARVLLAGTALTVIWLVPQEPARYVAVTRSSATCSMASSWSRSPRAFPRRYARAGRRGSTWSSPATWSR